jgi:hypothetical protein
MNEDIESRLRNLRLTGPSEQFRERVTSAAIAAWRATSTEVAWWIPIRRLGIAAAVAMAVVWFADYAGDRTATGWESVEAARVSKSAPDLNTLGDETDGLLAGHVACFPQRIDVSVIRQYQEEVRRILDEQG